MAQRAAFRLFFVIIRHENNLLKKNPEKYSNEIAKLCLFEQH